MILQDLVDLTVAAITADPWFSEVGKVVSAVPSDLLDLNQTITNALANIGITVVVDAPKMVESERINGHVITLICTIAESTVINRSSSGSQKTAQEVCERLAALLHLVSVNEDVYTPCELVRIEEMGASDDGKLLWETEFRVITHLNKQESSP